jgi:hypothetical protein
VTDKTIDLDRHRGMIAQKATEPRRLPADVEANEKALRLRQDELEARLLAPRRRIGTKLRKKRATFSICSPGR